ncbi:SRPBCC family protein [Chloroflexota bacterium]
MRVESSVEIAAPPGKVWPFLIEPEKVLKWCITFRKYEYSSEQRSGVDTPLYIEEKVSPMPLMKLNFKVTDWVENERLAFSLTSGNLTKGYDQSWTLKAIPSGSSFTFYEDFTMPFGIIGKLMGVVGRSSSETHVREMLSKLKGLAEA